MTLFATLQQSLLAATTVPYAINVDHMTELRTRLDALYTTLRSNEYPCPICHRSNSMQSQETIGTVTLDWDHEYVDGYAVSSWPVFSSTCEDAEREPETRRGASRRYSVFDRKFPRNHGEQLTDSVENEEQLSHVDYILGSAQERRRLRALLGIPDPR